ncbi:MAG: radical SAM protein [Lachnospiraceae bacterium]|nr:radical SAM protein [Lachnospiraceae bacterium]
MKLLIYGAGNNGKIFLKLLKNDYVTDYQITGFIDREKNEEYCGYPIFKLKDVGDFTGRIIIAIANLTIAVEIYQELKEKGFKDIVWFHYKKDALRIEDIFAEQCISCEKWGGSVLPQVEMHIIDSCNLNCRGCAHFSPIFPDDLPDLNLRMYDVKRLKEKFSHIVRFYILGGEPFLNPEIDRYICGIRTILPDTQLYIVTNGLLIERLPEKILQCIRDNQVWVSISEYKPTCAKIHDICRVLDHYQILYEIRKGTSKESFNLPLSLSTHSKFPQACISNGCVTIWNGKIARCPQLMYISYFNYYYHTDLPEDGIIELKENIAGENLLNLLKKDVPLCKHCVRNEIKWSVCGKKAKLEDFAVYD